MNSVIIREENFDKARQQIRKNKEKEIIFTGRDDELNRKILEKETITIFMPILKGRKDKQKQRDSGLNVVMAKLAKKKGIIIGINYDEIVDSEGKEKAEIIGRLKQNIKICNKEKLKMKFITEKKVDKYDLKALGLSLGMSTKMVKDL